MTVAGSASPGFPEPIALTPDRSTRCSDGARTVLGGSPFRLLRFTDAGAAAVDRVLAGTPVGAHPDAGAADRTVARLLLDAGMAHPVGLRPAPLSVSVVVPVRDDQEGLASLTASLAGADPGDLAGGPGVVEVVVVDDASMTPMSIPARVDVASAGPVPVRVEQLASNRGPGGARNAGWSAASADVVVFVDADVVVEPGWLAPLLGHLSDPAVGAVAPRVRSRPGPSVRERYERANSPLDLGPTPARVLPGSRVSYVPSAVLAVRRSVLRELDGFDPGLRVGEDVDLVWRLLDAGHGARYEPAAAVTHRARADLIAMARQRHAYGRAAAALDARHPGQVAPVVADPWSLAAWSTALLAGAPGVVAGVATTTWSIAALARRLAGRVPDPRREALRLAGGGTLALAPQVGRAITRAWGPAALLAALAPGRVGRRIRRVLLAAAVGPALQEWWRRRPSVDPLRWTALSVADDVAYASGVWRGVASARSARALRPRSARIPGLPGRHRRSTAGR